VAGKFVNVAQTQDCVANPQLLLLRALTQRESFVWLAAAPEP
jgi:hypothetical protein